MDVFGRIVGNHSASSANIFKIQGPHNGMVLMFEHSFLELTGPMFGDMFSVAWRWFQKANQNDGRAKFPSIGWDLLIHAGASQVGKLCNLIRNELKPKIPVMQFCWLNLPLAFSGLYRPSAGCGSISG